MSASAGEARVLTKLSAAHTEPCISCSEGMPRKECSKSQRECGHHCNHSWSHDECCWCGEKF